MKIKVACFAAILLLVAGPAEADEPDGAVDDAATSATDAQLDAEPDVVSASDGSATSDTGVPDAGLDVVPASDGGTLSDAEADGSAGNVDGGPHDGGGGPVDAGPPPPPLHNFLNESPGCSLGGAPDAAVGALGESALVALLLVRRRRADRHGVKRGG
jgi:MYXO-CTERM domain-containing protein